MDAIIGFLNTIFWGYVLIYGLLAVGVYFTIRLGGIQFRHFGEFFRVIRKAPETDDQGITPFQALTVSLASRVGVGNIAGVAVALNLGGPGAIFWMWMVALVGMATAYSESTLAQLYKTHGPRGMYRGGPAFYISHGMNMPWLGAIFSVCLILSFGLVFNAVQANSIAQATQGAFGIPTWLVGLVIAGLVAVVIFGGIRKIAAVAEKVVPAMAGVYLLVALIILIMNIGEVPGVLGQIVGSALGFSEVAGGVTGGVMAAMMNGVKRGLFSNEAGMGSAPNIAAVATPVPHHPSSQGFVQALGVFIDTLVICTCTAVIILLSGVYVPGGEETGTVLTQSALTAEIGAFGGYFIAIAIFFFAFTSIIGNYSYSENAMVYLGAGDPKYLTILRSAVVLMVIWGSLQAVSTVFNAADASMGLMATINLIAIVTLSGTVIKLTKDYFAQRAQGIEPVFHAADYPELERGIEHAIWYRESVHGRVSGEEAG
ncbi:alanine/glycine:cation symporter family protein [Tropicimonas isoalkanivorans]|uniref:Alanine or glycine:cation symporter, AGCS family n=1 Tax=Tropicimonas isoalkanivorans TaxID=441112 RepID=A0A1I1LGL3_9RHOB|nr:sodium:alanine symporter family protein [Tropicimonas isoalkanivorans]SFC69513.1 alanine or glycine:cation symporter, AGCS family [Tropicimonas isoalkanivorans]